MIGILSGMVMQRDENNLSRILLSADTAPKDAAYTGAACGQAQLTPLPDGRICLSGIPVGGPYTVRLDEQEYTDIYVGDVWLLAGQSNMEGIGHTTQADMDFMGDPAVRAFYMIDRWDVANHPLHTPGWAVDTVHNRVIGSGYPNYAACIGPGLSFALTMKKLTDGVPQGVIACAHSGTSMSQWSPSLRERGGEGSLYGAALRRFAVCGSHVRGLFWYQGCNETTEEEHPIFTAVMEDFYATCRRDFGDIPIVSAQIGRVTNRTIPLHNDFWDSVQEQQRQQSLTIPRLAMLSTVSKDLDDAIHLSSASQRQLGQEAAEAMYHLLYGTDEKGCLPPPRLKSVSLTPGPFNRWAVVRVQYENLHGQLISQGRPAGFTIDEAAGDSPTQYVHHISLEGDTVLLYADRLPEVLLNSRLYYGKGCNPYCNITDEAGRAIPVMGPIVLDHIDE